MSEKSEKKYIPYIDVIKGFAIFLVVMGHVLAWQFDSLSVLAQSKESTQAAFLWRMIYSFHMPLFFFVSGFLFSMTKFNNIDVPKFIWKKFVTLIVPFVTMGTLFYLVRDKMYNYWFLRSLFEFILIALPFEILRSRKEKMQSLSCSIVYYGVVNGLLIIACQYLKNYPLFSDLLDIRYNYFLFFSVGLVFQRNCKLMELLNKNCVYTICLLGYALSLLMDNRFSDIITAAFAIGACWYLFKNVFTNGFIIDKLSYLGRNSLEIYLLHFFFSISVTQLGAYWLEKSQIGGMKMLSVIAEQFVFSLFISVAIIMLSLSIANIINKSRFLSALFLGRSSKI